MADFTNDSEKVLAKAQELMDKKSHSYLGVVHLAHGLLEAPDARLKNLYRAKKANIKEMQAKLAPFLDSVPKLMEVNPDAGRPDEDLSRVLRAAIQAGRKCRCSSRKLPSGPCHGGLLPAFCPDGRTDSR